VEIAVAAGELDVARASTDELAAIADEYPTPWLAAVTTQAQGRLELAAGDAGAACGSLRHALEQMQALAVPYEVAETRLLLGAVLRAIGDEGAAAVSFEAAVEILERLGADGAGARRRAEQVGTAALPKGLTGREAEVLQLVA